MTKQIITADIPVETYDELDLSFNEFEVLLKNLRASIGGDPELSRVHIEFEDDPYDGGGSLKAYVYRNETDEEEDEREAAYAKREAERRKEAARTSEERERAQYLALKKKFES